MCPWRRRPLFLENPWISYNLALWTFLGPELLARNNSKHEKHKHVLSFSLFSFLSDGRPGGKRGGVQKARDTKKLTFSKKRHPART